MKKYRIHLHETICGEVTIEAETRDDAEREALDDLGKVCWERYGGEVEVDYVREIDEQGNEIELD